MALIEKMKTVAEVMRIDDRHLLLGQVVGSIPSIESIHTAIDAIYMHEGVPEEIVGQFNIARNMALYTYFMMTLAPEVQFKTFRVIELSLRIKAGVSERVKLHAIIEKAKADRWIVDSGFRHVVSPNGDNQYCTVLLDSMKRMRNGFAHGGTNMTPDFVRHISICADLVNQLFFPYKRTW